MADLAKFMELVKGASTAELHEFKSILDRQLRVSFKVGDKVRFDAGYRGVITGRVTKVNQKTVSVKADTGMNWKVHPTFLSKV